MKRIFTFAILALAATLVVAQTATSTLPSNIYSLGGSYNQGGTPQYAATALYMHLASDDSKTYAGTVIDVLPVSKSPFTVTTNMGVGVFQKILTVGSVDFWNPTTAGITITGTNAGWNWTSGVIADYQIKKAGVGTSSHIQPFVRYVKSSVSNGDGYKLIGGFLYSYQPRSK